MKQVLTILFIATQLVVWSQDVEGDSLTVANEAALSLSTGAQVKLQSSSFNRGNIHDPMLLAQGKVAGASIYNRGGDPNTLNFARIRGLTSLQGDVYPLVVVDGILDYSLNNLDPRDIESLEFLKDASAAAIYGMRGADGVVVITTKAGERDQPIAVSYDTQLSISSLAKKHPNMSPAEFVAAGGNDIGSETDWQDLVTRSGISNNHSLRISGGSSNMYFAGSTNFRQAEGVLNGSQVDRISNRANLTFFGVDDRLKASLHLAQTTVDRNYSFNEAFRYAIVFNPTAPVFSSTGSYFEPIIFDNFNPVALQQLNQNLGEDKYLNLNGSVSFDVTPAIKLFSQFGKQYSTIDRSEYYSSRAFFVGLNRNGLARRSVSDLELSQFDFHLSHQLESNRWKVESTIGYFYQQRNFEQLQVELGNFPNDDLLFNGLENSGDLLNGGISLLSSESSPKEEQMGFFGHVKASLEDNLILTASLRRDGSTRLGTENQWGIFPSLGLNANLKNYLSLEGVQRLNFRLGYGKTGSLPFTHGLSQDQFEYRTDNGGTVRQIRVGNPSLRWNEKTELNAGFDFALKEGKIRGSLDFYNQNLENLIVLTRTELFLERYENAGSLSSKGLELSLEWKNIVDSKIQWTPGLVLSSNRSTLETFPGETVLIAPAGAPGQGSLQFIKRATGAQVGQIWGPVFESVSTDGFGEPIFSDLNGDGVLVADLGSALTEEADFETLGNGLPTVEFGWTNQVSYGRWTLNAFFRGALGHSLINTFRLFYEPLDIGAINSYNRVKTDLQVSDLQSSRFSSLYVEKADFIRLDNITLQYEFDLDNSTWFKGLNVYLNAQNLFTVTSYQGIDPDPVFIDVGPVSNGFRPIPTMNSLAPGIDRRNNYPTSRTFTLGLSTTF